MIIHTHISWTMWHHYTNSVTFTYFLTNENITTLQSLWWIDGIVAWISIHQVSSGFHYSSTPQIYQFFLFFAQSPSLSALSPVLLSSMLLSHTHFSHYIIKWHDILSEKGFSRNWHHHHSQSSIHYSIIFYYLHSKLSSAHIDFVSTIDSHIDISFDDTLKCYLSIYRDSHWITSQWISW